ncbi:cytochrome family protein [Rhodopseudomonas sp. P2A-2r]|uniref:cytochrome family protein n=1 Tax=unclassified Rhodopseudomonas TaxID=2638247 RepID=UPI002234D7F5|nr:cytochrome family protein [Rhodopseudomonas sp. P2A-2r]UZE50088.1 cytochrome family protein [Rhodopseudomonas sp. P2A-2r]
MRSAKGQIVVATGVSLLICSALMFGVPARAQSPQPPKAADASAYLPSVSDLMIATIQPRHIRIWLAAKRQNWEFASYELGNLKGAFRRLSVAHPMQGNVPLQDMIASVTADPIADLEKAIKAKDLTSFAKAYDSLTEGCNSCHAALNHQEVVIKVPEGFPASTVDDLDLSPQKR